MLNSLRSGQEQIAINTSAIVERSRSLEARLEALRVELAPLTFDLGAVAPPASAPVAWSRSSRRSTRASRPRPEGLRQARGEGPEADRLEALADVHTGAERATRHARRAEGLLGERHRERLGEHMAEVEGLMSRSPN